MKIRKAYSFDDLFLVPKYSSIPSRSPNHIDLSVDLGKGVILENPIISANMLHVSGPKLVGKLAALGGLGILHRFDNDILKDFNDAVNFSLIHNKDPLRLRIPLNNIGISIGLEQFGLLYEYVKIGGKIVCVDVAHGHHLRCIELVKKIHETFPELLLIAGNVATAKGAYALYEAGADVIKVGVGSGSLCSTRIETGNGVPQMTVLDDVRNWFDNCWEPEGRLPAKIISDGGMRSAGDVVKSLCFADAVMLGNMLAGTDESPGEVLSFGGKQYKQYAGSSTHKQRNIEGVKALVPTKGPLEDVVTKILEGVRSGCSYQGVTNLVDLKDDPEFVEVSNAGLIESRPHDVILG